MRGDYAAHHVLDQSLPSSFEEWEQEAEDAAGPPGPGVLRVVIRPNEYCRWCVAEWRTPDSAAREAFAKVATRRAFPAR